MLLNLLALANKDNSVTVCISCAEDIKCTATPEHAFTTKQVLAPIPLALTNLTLLERLLITKRFHCIYIINPSVATTFNVVTKTISKSSSFYLADQMPISDALLLKLLNICVLLRSMEEAPRLAV